MSDEMKTLRAEMKTIKGFVEESLGKARKAMDQADRIEDGKDPYSDLNAVCTLLDAAKETLEATLDYTDDWEGEV